MAPLGSDYTALMNDVLAVNYWGELLSVELLSGLLTRNLKSAVVPMVVRQLMDETRHANITRAFLKQRGRDPVKQDAATQFLFQKLFGVWSRRSAEEVLVFLGQNERTSARNFNSSKTSPEVPDRTLGWMEEAAAVMWLLTEEHRALLDRVRELFGSTEPMEVPDDIRAFFDSPEPSLPARVYQSLVTRNTLMSQHLPRVDTHTRLVFRKHSAVVSSLIIPTLKAVMTKAEFPPSDPHEDRGLSQMYARFLPRGARLHPDEFLRTALLKGKP